MVSVCDPSHSYSIHLPNRPRWDYLFLIKKEIPLETFGVNNAMRIQSVVAFVLDSGRRMSTMA